jgi:hypothetical protein
MGDALASQFFVRVLEPAMKGARRADCWRSGDFWYAEGDLILLRQPD